MAVACCPLGASSLGYDVSTNLMACADEPVMMNIGHRISISALVAPA